MGQRKGYVQTKEHKEKRIKSLMKFIKKNPEKYVGKNNGMYGKTHSLNTIEKLSKSTQEQWKNKTEKEKQKTVELLSKYRFYGKQNGMYGKHFSEETIKLLSKIRTGTQHTKETRKLQRKIAIKRIERQKLNGLPLTPCIGEQETPILDKLEKQYNHKIVRQYRIAGYFLDGYIPELNIAFEVDESHHFTNDELSKYDIQRQQEIEMELSCQFIRIKV